MNFNFYLWLNSHDGVGLGNAHHYAEWNFEGGAYMGQEVILPKTTGVDCYVAVDAVFDHVYGLTSGASGQIAQLEILVYDVA
jgi:hypothetical protein